MFSFLHQLTTWNCPHMLLHAMLWRSCCWLPAVQQSITISCLLGPQQQTPLQQHAVAEWWDGQTDRQTDVCSFIDPALHTMWAVTINRVRRLLNKYYCHYHQRWNKHIITTTHYIRACHSGLDANTTVRDISDCRVEADNCRASLLITKRQSVPYPISSVVGVL